MQTDTPEHSPQPLTTEEERNKADIYAALESGNALALLKVKSRMDEAQIARLEATVSALEAERDEAVRDAPTSSAGTSPDEEGTFTCRLCGQSGPHAHGDFDPGPPTDDAGILKLACDIYSRSAVPLTRQGELTTATWRLVKALGERLHQPRAGTGPETPPKVRIAALEAENARLRADRAELTEAYEAWAGSAEAPDFDAIGDNLGRLCLLIQDASHPSPEEANGNQ